MLRAPLPRAASLATFRALAIRGTALLAILAPAATLAAQAPDGRALAAELGCGACHAGMPVPDVARARAPALGTGGAPLDADFVFTYLGAPERRRTDIGATRMPDFRLDEAERLALALFLGSGAERGAVAEARRVRPDADAALGKRIFQALGCAGCHAGVEGAAGVAGPDLSREGARARTDWLSAYLARPTPIRGPAHPAAPGARMPDFRLGEGEVAALAAWLGGLGAPFAELPRRALTAAETRRTERFLEARTSCLGCHRIGGRGGAIGPSLEGVALRARESFVLESILDPGRAAPGSAMPHQPMPRREAERLARRLLDVGAGAPAAPASPSLADPAHPAWIALGRTGAGAALYARHCAACHGASGGGDGWNAADLPVPPTRHADGALMSRRVDDALYDAIHAGARVLDGSPRMPGFGEFLAPDEIRSLVAHIRTLCACEAPAWSRDGGKDVR